MKTIKLAFFLSAFLVTFFGILGLGKSVLAAEYYVSPTGNATWNNCNNINTPCNCYVAAQNAIAGDMINFRGGVYEIDFGRPSAIWGDSDWQHASIEVAHSGTAENPITFQAYPGEVPVLTWDASTIVHDPNRGSAMLGVYQKEWIIWDGLHVIGRQEDIARDKIFNIWFGKHITIKNCDLQGSSVTNPYNSPIIFSDGDNTNPTEYFLITNNKIHGANSSEGDNSAGFMFYDSNQVTISNNDFYDNQNAIYDKSGSNNVYCNNNFFYNNQLGYLFMATASNRVNININNNIFANNTVYDISISRIGDTVPAVTVTDFSLYNNTFYSSVAIRSLDGTWHNQPNSMINTEIYNNLFNNEDPVYNTRSDLIDYLNFNNYYNVSSFNIDTINYYNLSSWQVATSFDLNSHTDNPNFVNPGGTSPEDYKRASYPTNGRSGVYAPVMGAYVTGIEIIGYNGESDKISPNVPTNLNVL